MSFFDLSDGTKAGDIGTTVDVDTGMLPLPDGIVVTALMEKFEYKEFNGVRKLKFRAAVLRPSEYENRKAFLGLNLFDANEEKRNKAKKLFAGICNIVGGRALKLLELDREPTEEELELALSNKPISMKLKAYNITEAADGTKLDKPITGNFLVAVGPRDGAAKAEKAVPQPRAVKEVVPKFVRAAITDDFDDDIPF